MLKYIHFHLNRHIKQEPQLQLFIIHLANADLNNVQLCMALMWLGMEFHIIVPWYAIDLKPCFIVWKRGCTSMSLSRKSCIVICLMNNYWGTGGDRPCNTLKTNSASAFFLLYYIIGRFTRVNSTLYADMRSLHTTLSIRLFNVSILLSFFAYIELCTSGQ